LFRVSFTHYFDVVLGLGEKIYLARGWSHT
jgi:hypothetical protein